MGKIFISYRRDDSGPITGRIFDCLLARFGPGSVSMDVDSIPFGVDFRAHISNEMSRCDVVLAIIGEHWLDARQNDQRRLDDPQDYVRIELEAALKRGIPVVPVVVGKASIPPADSLPESLRDLAYRNAAPVDNFRDFHPHMDRLIRDLETHLPGLRPGAQAAAGTMAQLGRFCRHPNRIRDAGAVSLVFSVLGLILCVALLAGVATGNLSTDRPAVARELLIVHIAASVICGWLSLATLARKSAAIWAGELISSVTLVFQVALLAGLDLGQFSLDSEPSHRDAGGLLKEPVVKFVVVTIQMIVEIVCFLLFTLALVAFYSGPAVSDGPPKRG